MRMELGSPIPSTLMTVSSSTSLSGSNGHTMDDLGIQDRSYPDTAAETRWPDFLTAVQTRTPVRSLLSIQLFTTGSELGSLNFYADTPAAFDRDAEDVAINYGVHTALAIAAAKRDQQFQSALASRDIIGQAKGMLMERYNLDSSKAFDLLTQLSQNSNIKVHDLATQLVNADHPPTP